MRSKWKTVLGLAVSALFLWWTFRGEDLGEIGRQLASADPVWLLTSGALLTSGGLIRALRWRLLLSPLRVETSLYSRWAAVNIGFMVTNVYPARLGEIVRPYALSRMTPVSMSGALGTVVLERIVDTIALMFLLVLAVLSPAFPESATVMGHTIAYAVWGAISLAAAAIAIVGALVAWPSQVKAVLAKIARLLPGHLEDGLAARLDAFLSGLELMRQPAALAKAVAWSLLLWVWMAASFWAAFRAFGIDLGATAAMFTQCAVGMFVAIPAGPGFIGTLQAGVAVSVEEVFGIAAEPTLSMAVGYHLAGFIPVTLLGLYYASRLGLRLKSVESDAGTALESGG